MVVSSCIVEIPIVAKLVVDNAAMSLLDTATNDLTQLTNKLDLDTAVEMTSISQHSALLLDPSSDSPPVDQTESSVKHLPRKNSSMTSLKPYVQSCSQNASIQLGQSIAPWSTLNASISPLKSSLSMIKVGFQDDIGTARTHR